GLGVLCYATRCPLSPAIFFFPAEDGIRVRNVTGVQTCALPISRTANLSRRHGRLRPGHSGRGTCRPGRGEVGRTGARDPTQRPEIGRASCRERGERSAGAGSTKEKIKRRVRNGWSE